MTDIIQPERVRENKKGVMINQQTGEKMYKDTIKNIWEITYKTFLLIGGFLFAFSWIIIGVTLLPQIAHISRDGSLVPLLTSLGVLMGMVVIIYLTLSNLIKSNRNKGR